MKKIFIILMILCLSTSALTVQAVLSTPVQKIKVLLVPGHDDETWGAQYGNVKEADMTCVLATKIYETLKKNSKFEVFITRDKNGYTKEFQDYFTNHREEIISFRDSAKSKTKEEIASGNFVVKTGVPHISASEDMSIKLFGINKWANENKIDMVLHIHFNDYPRVTKWKIGKYKGVAIYVPDSQMVNSKISYDLAKSIYKKLMTKYVSSTYPKESTGIIGDQTLIALGANGTLEASTRSVLVEYGYIYGKIFRNYNTRQKAYQNMANLTVLGIKNYFKDK